MAPQVLHRVIYGTTKPTHAQSSALTIRDAILPGFTRHRVAGCDYPAIVPDDRTPNACVRGTLVDGLTARDIWRLDIFEAEQYERRFITCKILEQDADANQKEVAKGAEVRAETYIWTEDFDMLEDREWDFDEFRTEKIGQWIGMEQYSEVDDAVERARHEEDPTGGRSRGGEITKKLDDESIDDREILECAV